MNSTSRIAVRMLAPILGLIATPMFAQPYGEPDRGQPGDSMIQQYLRQEAAKLETDFLGGIKSAEDWSKARPRYREEYFQMLGLWPLPEKTPLHATVTGTLDRGDYLVEMLHYQSRPGLYVTANVYRPAKIEAGQRLPAVLYVCGHSSRGRNGGKAAFQSHGIWFARHGYVCMIVDTLQLGEIAGIHHGTYREGRWWWLSRGYTPAGVECWNGVRGIDYLVSRPDVAPDRIGVTGISGGGAATFWISAADERVKVAVPVSGMADLESYVPNRVINGHCDCMFLYNAHQWPWTRIAALIAPRPLLFMNSDHDGIFPMDANDRVIARLERLYSLFGSGDLVDSFVSIGGHAYRKDIRQASFRFINIHLKNDPRPVLDSEADLVTGPREEIHPIQPEQLRVFPKDSDIPSDALNRGIDREFVPMASIEPPPSGGFGAWKAGPLEGLRKLSFHHFPERIPAAVAPDESSTPLLRLNTEAGITVGLRVLRNSSTVARRIVVLIAGPGSDAKAGVPDWLGGLIGAGDTVLICEPRGTGTGPWSAKNPPNYVARSHYLLGRTVESGRVWDIAATARYLQSLHRGQLPIFLAGENQAAALAVYAALLEPEISGLILYQPPASHMDESAPPILNVLRVCDIPEAMGMLAPRSLTLIGPQGDAGRRAEAIYRAAGASNMIVVRK
jgi:dienelactone hydrolase